MSIQPPRFFTFCATDGFDGTTAFDKADLANSPGNPLDSAPVTANQARIFGFSATSIGRLAWDDLVRPGNVGAIVMVRAVGGPEDETDRVEVRTAAADEAVDGEAVPFDALQQTIMLSAEWSEPFLLEPRDALAVYFGRTRSAIQLIVQELDTQALIAWITAKAQSHGQDFAQSSQVVTIDTLDETVDITATDSDLITVMVDAETRGTLQLPSWSDLREGAVIEVFRVRADVGHEGTVLIAAQAGEQINSGNASIYLPLEGAIRLRREALGNRFCAVSHSEVQARVVIAGNLSYTFGWPGRRIVRLTEAAGQTVTLPAYSTVNNVPIDCTLLAVNRSASSKTIAGAGAEVITGGGATANTYALAANSCAVVSFDGTQWTVA